MSATKTTASSSFNFLNDWKVEPPAGVEPATC